MKSKKNKKQTKSNKNVSILILVAIVLVIAIVIGILLMGTGKKMDKDIVVFETSMGNIEIKLHSDLMPITTGNFKKLVNEGFYDGIKFHRVIDGFMVQGGGFTKQGNQKQTKAPIKLESNLEFQL
jgi:hypothetical protein